MTLQEIISSMTLKQKIHYCSGADFWHTLSSHAKSIPPITMSDGPHGLRFQDQESDMLGVHKSKPSTCFPTAVTSGATWNKKLLSEEGKAIGEEAITYGVDVVLGPGCNIKRNPLCGRNFEYFSEDPYLAGKMAAEFVKGQQSTGVASCLKHFAANNQEFKRMNGDSMVDERTLREIYLAPFEIAVREAAPETVMCSYNKINGVHSSDNFYLLTQVLRQEWGFDGMVVTDWGAMNDRIQAFRAGCDLNMPGGVEYMENEVLKAVEEGALLESEIDRCVERILKLALKSVRVKKGMKYPYDEKSHQELACEIARQGAVLLKNEDSILPLSEESLKKCVILGDMADHYRFQGAGSSHIHPTHTVSLLEALPGVSFERIVNEKGDLLEDGEKKAAQAAAAAETVIIVAGLPEQYESEGFDRDDMRMPEGHLRMIRAAASANPNVIVVLLAGSAMELPWIDEVKAVLFMGLSGQEGALACADLLTGKAVPGGKLTETWPNLYDDVICKDQFMKRNVEYREGLYVGYRYYDKAKKEVRFPFGYGLSYSSFAYSDLKIHGSEVSFILTNTGDFDADEVVQLYVAPPQEGIYRPLRELKDFDRISLKKGESKRVSFTMELQNFAIWQNGWRVPSGTYEIQIGSSSRDLRLTATIKVEGEEIAKPEWQEGTWYETLIGYPQRTDWLKAMVHPVYVHEEEEKGHYTMDNSVLEMKDHSLVMKIMYKAVEMTLAKNIPGEKNFNNSEYRMMITTAVDCPMRSLVINSSGAIQEKIGRGLLEMANGRMLKGIGEMLKK